MNSVEIKTYIQQHSQQIIDDVFERIATPDDPLTGERWADNPFLTLTYVELLKWAGKVSDAPPKGCYNNNRKKSLRNIINAMLRGEIDAETAANMSRALIAFMDARQRIDANKEVSEIKNMVGRFVVELPKQ